MIRAGALAVVLAAGCAHSPEPAPTLDTFAAYLPAQSASRAPFEPSRLHGKVVLLTFITTWCFPCLTDFVTLHRLEDLYGKLGFTNVLVGLDLEGAKVLQPFAESYQLSWPLVVGDDRLRSGETPFGKLRELPARLLFDRDGKVIVAYTGVADPAALEKLVGEAVKR